MQTLGFEQAGKTARHIDQHVPGGSSDVASHALQFLDEVLPLRDASHSDVVSYSIEIPMRYAECFATLQDGRKVGLVDRRRFVGWRSDDGNRCYLFRKNLMHIEVRIACDASTDHGAASELLDIIVESAVRTVQNGALSRSRLPRQERRFIGIDGSQVALPGRRLTRLITASRLRQ